MTRIVTVILLVLALAGTAHTLTRIPTPVLDALPSAVNLAVADSEGTYYNVCSGSVVNLPEGPRIVTAGHCIRDDMPLYARDAEGHYYTTHVERYELDRDHAITDWAVLRSTYQYLATPLEIADTPLSTGESVYVWSGPKGLNLKLFTGYVSGFFDGPIDAIRDMPYVTMNSDKGASGSIVLNANGEATGILTNGWTTDIKLHGVLLSTLPPALD